jgi:hypothetical protein
MIKLVYCIRRKADIPAEDFHRYWLHEHGPKVRAVAARIGARKYVQSHTITEVWFENEAAMAQALGTTDGVAAAKQLLEDESTFIDFATSCIFMTQEHDIF